MKKETGGDAGGVFRFWIINIIRIVLGLAFIFALIEGRKLILLFSLVGIIFTFIPAILKRLFNVKVPGEFEITVILFIYGILLFSEVKGDFSGFAWWGILVSIASSAALGLVGLSLMHALYKGEVIKAGPFIIASFSFCFAVALGTLWEFFEFFLDKTFYFHLQKSTNTMTNITANILGALFVSTIGYFYIKEKKNTVISRMITSFVEKNPKMFGASKGSSEEEVASLIKTGEGNKVEFKSTLRTNLYTNQIDRKMELAVLKTISAYMNSNGGTLLVGVSNNGDIVGVEKDNFPSVDKLNLHFHNLVNSHIGSEYLPFIKFTPVKINGKTILRVDCEKSHKAVFLKAEEEEFYVRNGAASVKLLGSSLVDYISHNFRQN